MSHPSPPADNHNSSFYVNYPSALAYSFQARMRIPEHCIVHLRTGPLLMDPGRGGGSLAQSILSTVQRVEWVHAYKCKHRLYYCWTLPISKILWNTFLKDFNCFIFHIHF